MLKALVALTTFVVAYGFHVMPRAFCRSRMALSAALGDAVAQIGLMTALNTQSASPAYLSRSFPIAKVETRQGMYKEYTVDITEDDKRLDDARSTFKTAEQTEESKNKYWTIFAVFLVGSFVIPMAQYYWYVADEDDDEDYE